MDRPPARLGEGDDGRDEFGERKPDAQGSPLVADVVTPMIRSASEAFLERLGDITVDDLCNEAERRSVFGESRASYDFTI